MSTNPKWRTGEASRNQTGSALLIVLAFVVLLTGLILAFFSRSVLNQQVSVSSANQVKVDSFIAGAVACTVSDLKQEIEAGSTVNYPVTGNYYISYDDPLVTSSRYPTMMPYITGSTLAAPGTGTAFGSYNLGSGKLLNLIKMSLHSQKLYLSTSPPYNTTPTNPARASTISTGTSGDSSASTLATGAADGTSLNGRYISGARWKKPLFIDPTVNFPLPDWIYVPRSPAGVTVNPTTWNANMMTAPANMAMTTTIVGRYAYVIYDEGSLLDINVAGVPSPIASTSSNPVYSAYKDNLAMADLTQIGLTQTQIDTIVGWRNNASAAQSPNSTTSTPLSGTVSTGYAWSGTTGFTSATNYWANVVGNPTGFLRPMSAWPTTPSGLTQSDQFFTSRQQLIQFFNQILGGGTTVQTTLQYLTHFSRGLNQPSYVPPSGKPASTATSVGGNDKGGGDATINPSFLAARVTTAYTRNDKSPAAVGDPLVNRRFALSRLAWLTYLGPIADDNGNLNNNPSSSLYVGGNAVAFTALIKQLEATYGYSDAFLAQGGPTNIYNYFGLSWVVDNRSGIGDSRSKWVYNHENATYSTTLTAALATTVTAKNSIRTLSTGTWTVASQNRDPDFFELLKASSTLGSLAKAYSYVASPDATTPAQYQQQRDNSVDLQIVQMGANIIDQSDADGYPTAILFTDGALFGGTVQEIRGVEDLPYLYRVREGKITIKDSTPTQAALPTIAQSTITSSNAGLIAVLQEPEIWNPHAWSTTNPDTNPRPTNFRVVAISTNPNLASSSAVAVTPQFASMQWSGLCTTTAPATTTPGPAWNEANSELDFSIPLNNLALFREPTLLVKPGVPTNSNLALGPGHLITTSLNPSGNALGSGATYIKTLWPARQFGTTLTDNQQYIGFLAGTGPAAWAATILASGITAAQTTPSAPASPASATPGITASTKVASLVTAVPGITYRMQYKDASGNWATYDEKYLPYLYANSYNFGIYTPGDTGGTVAGLASNQNKTFNTYQTATPFYQDDIIGVELSGLYFDPRTSRFGGILAGPNGRRSGHGDQFPLRQEAMGVGWAAGTATSGAAFSGAMSQLALATTRPDSYAGFSFSYYGNPSAFLNTGPSTVGWYPASTIYAILLPGMFAQNNPAESTTVVNNSQVNPTLSAQAEFTTYNTGPPATAIPADVFGFNQYFADADKVVRRGMSAYVPTSATWPAVPPTSGPTGLPLATATDYSGSTPAPIAAEQASRPLLLNRPFRSVAELGCVFSGTPWRNLDMSTPESGSAALLDVFCVNDTEDASGLVAGKVNLNTRQPLVLQAILNGAYQDELGLTTGLSTAYATSVASAVVARTSATTAGQGPLTNPAELVGKWNASVAVGTSVNGSKSFLGLTSDLVNGTSNDLTQALAAAGSTDDAITRVQRYRDASVRALANSGQTRVWNLMIDVIAQTGRFPSTATGLANFYVEGEQRYWVHLAIDRSTGKVIDQQIEVIKE